MKRWVVGLVGLLVLAGCSTGDDAVVAGSDFQLVAPAGQVRIRYDAGDRKVVRGLSGPDVRDGAKTVNLDDYAGKVVVVNIWGSWCPPCRTEAPELQKVQDELGADAVQVLGVAVKESSTEGPRDFLANRGLKYPSIYDESGRSILVFKGLPPNAVPSTFVLDKQHRVAAVFLVGVIASDITPIVKELSAE
ncbi:TlpA disulfide reductase family protein [Saccharothrix variisporea]|uniref:Peroxiredoxin n=1 Tax=Saccharothrix variisporea TaxID=543527 RepID=A0A495XE69_9PSEU|nr:TlpA disulfide reductase family protein [Saccharothrix variisporea]RKT71979.1 peroxiredoxin [Saccharothrix variisporea]